MEKIILNKWEKSILWIKTGFHDVLLIEAIIIVIIIIITVNITRLFIPPAYLFATPPTPQQCTATPPIIHITQWGV